MKADKKASKNTFSVIFVIQKGKCRPDGKAPIVARITVNGEMVHFSTKMYIEPERWLPLEYKTKGQTHEEQVINSTLFDFHATIKRKYNDMIYRGEVITASKIKSSILCQDERSMTLIALCNKYIEDYEKLVLTQDYGQESFFRYKVCRNRLQEFLRDEFKVSDLPLQDINKRFLDKLYLWLRSAHRLNNKKLFENRWYVLAHNIHYNDYRIYGLDRIEDLEITTDTFKLPKDFSASDYFSNYYGIISDSNIKPERIVIRAYRDHIPYMNSLPLHHSQRLLEDNGEYADFELFLAPTFDFIMRLLSAGAMIEVISPLSLRKTLKGWVSDMYNLYKND